MELQKASKGELIVDCLYAIVGAVGFAYVSALIVALVTGNVAPLSEHPFYTAMFCLLAGSSFVNLCRNQSERFWKTVDLIWILSLVPSILMSLLIYYQSEIQSRYERMLTEAVIENLRDRDHWIEQQKYHCSPPEYPFEIACTLLGHRIWYVEQFGTEFISYKTYIEYPDPHWNRTVQLPLMDHL